jgi:transposase InsO family protein
MTTLKCERTLSELAQQFDVHPNQITEWKRQLQVRAADVFGAGGASPSEPQVDLKDYMRRSANSPWKMIFKRRAQRGGFAQRKAMIDRRHALPISQQARLVGIARSSVYYRAQPVSKPNTSRRNARSKIWPYLLRSMTINRANQVWALDTCSIPMAHGFVYLTAVVNWASREVLPYRVEFTMDAMHAVEALEEAFAKYGNQRSRQYRPGQPVHRNSVHRVRAQPGHPLVHGRQTCLARRRVCRARVAKREI